ncbi:MAG: AAA family ATPase [Methanobacteriota archaeon]
MINTIIIEGYRAIEKLEIHPKRINILVGANNSGKSSILEILSLLCTIPSGFIDNTGTNTWNHLSGVKKYDPSSLIHTGSPQASISITSPTQELSLQLTYAESAYEDREVGGKITAALLQLSESYLLSTDIISTIIQQGKKGKTSSGFNGMSFNTGSFNASHEEEEDELESTVINKIKENISQIAFQSPKTTIKLINNSILAYLYADIRMRDYLISRTPGYHSETAGIEKIISGLRPYYQWVGNQLKSPTAVRMRTGSDIPYINTLFEKMLADGSIRDFERLIQDKIPYVDDIRKS